MSVRLSNLSFKGAAPLAMGTPISREAICGVCRKTGENAVSMVVVWPTSDCAVVHKRCYESIEPLADRVAEIVSETFSISKDSAITRKIVHKATVRAVEQAIDPGTISSYLSENGMNALMKLFNTVGLDAARAAIACSEESDSSENEIKSFN